jgi:hypothetical protein
MRVTNYGIDEWDYDIGDYVTQHPLVHHPLENHHDLVVN